MNVPDAEKTLARVVQDYAEKPYAYWRERVEGDSIIVEPQSELAIQYQMEIQVFWDDKAEGDIRVMFAIDDGGVRSLIPLTKCIIVRRDVGERS